MSKTKSCTNGYSVKVCVFVPHAARIFVVGQLVANGLPVAGSSYQQRDRIAYTSATGLRLRVMRAVYDV